MTRSKLKSLLSDQEFQGFSADEGSVIVERILSDIKGRMMEDIVLLETEIADPKKQVFQLQFDVGEFDKVIADEENLTCEVYEIDENNFYVQYRKI